MLLAHIIGAGAKFHAYTMSLDASIGLGGLAVGWNMIVPHTAIAQDALWFDRFLSNEWRDRRHRGCVQILRQLASMGQPWDVRVESRHDFEQALNLR